MLSDNIQCDIAASTGIHNGEAAIKQLLVGAKAVQIASVLYKKGIKEISIILKEINDWMVNNNFDNIEQFRGKMNIKKSDNPAAYERVQFMKYFQV